MRQAKVLSPAQFRAVLHHVERGRYPERDRTMILLSFYGGLRACEIAGLRWGMVTDAQGEIATEIVVEASIAKARSAGVVPMSRAVREALAALRGASRPEHDGYVITSERGPSLCAHSVVCWFRRTYRALGFSGASSHSGRRTFITSAARRISSVGGSMRDVMELARHRSLAVTTRYVEADAEAKRRVVDLI